MRVNAYAEEITDRIELVTKTTPDGEFTGIRFYLYLPTTIPPGYSLVRDTPSGPEPCDQRAIKAPFLHSENDDDSSAITFWGKQDIRTAFRKALELLDDHYAAEDQLQK